MSLKINPYLAALIIAGILILIFLLFKGCKQSKLEVAAKEKAQSVADSMRLVLGTYKSTSDSSKKAYQDSLDFANGQLLLAKEQKLRTEAELQGMTKENRALIAKYKLAQYTDTTAVLTPAEFIVDCQGCFTNLEKSTGLIERYKNDLNSLQDNWDKQTKIYQNRFKELDTERLGFYNKINSLAKEQQKAIDKLKPHGRLYLSWGVLFQPYPIGAGAGLLYQNKYNLIWGAKYYYTKYGYQVETTINFPLSLRFK